MESFRRDHFIYIAVDRFFLKNNQNYALLLFGLIVSPKTGKRLPGTKNMG